MRVLKRGKMILKYILKCLSSSTTSKIQITITEISSYSSWLRPPKQPTANAGDNVRKRKISFTVCAIANCYSPSGNQCGEKKKLK